MTTSQDYLAEKKKIEANIVKPIEEAMAQELGEAEARSIVSRSLAAHGASPSPSPFEGQTPVTILAQRRIEIDLVKYFYRILAERHGQPAAGRLIGQAIVNDARAAGRQKASQSQVATDLTTFAQILPLWSSGGALDMTVLESTDKTLRYSVSRCGYADMYREMGLTDLGFLVSCGRDGAFMEGYAPGVTLERDKTIMTGDRTCEFCYRATNPR
ncbi:MAG: L-2-amino-thiazoline-4-carboxylic acid hydrolase [Deltaproteobacteria bacterium]|jgi:hypothetical protein|nr:L-2-amino-thiazoline-4-carboxylic acid hydrolase [Deltaproteobacteria bacterium]